MAVSDVRRGLRDRSPLRAALDGAQAAALVVAIVAGLAATFSAGPTRILAAGFVLVAVVGWSYPMIRAGLAVVAVLVLMADSLGNRPVDSGWVRVAIVALVVGAVLATRSGLVAMRPLGDDDRTRRVLARPATLAVPAIVLAALALAAYAVGPDLRIGDEHRGAPFSVGAGEVRDPAADRSPRALAPYLGFDQTLDTASRGDLGDAVVLRVEADAPDFWRGQSFDRWDGRTWSRSRAAPALNVASRSGVEPQGPDGDPVTFEQFEQRFRVEAPAIGELFAAYRPVAVGLPLRTYTYAFDGSVDLVRPLGRGSEYSVSSLRARVTPDVLRAHDPLTTDRRPPEGVMQGPVPDGVARLARRITADAPTTYDAIRAIEAWMGDHTEYTTEIPPLPRGADAVEQHLFVDRKGFCVQIATSTAVMLHSLDVPVRVGVGFTPGDQSLLGRNFTVRGTDAHAWVEVWFPGVGWQAFDPTADVPLAGEYDTSLLARIGRVVDRLLPLVVVLVVLGLGTGLWWWLRRRRRRPEPVWAADLLRRIEREGRARGRPRNPAETPAAYLDVLAAGPLPAPDELAVVARVVTAAAYGPDGADAASRAAAEAAWATATAVRPPRRGHGRGDTERSSPARV